MSKENLKQKQKTRKRKKLEKIKKNKQKYETKINKEYIIAKPHEPEKKNENQHLFK